MNDKAMVRQGWGQAIWRSKDVFLIEASRRGGCCEDCQTAEGRFMWHHIDPTTKRYGISSMRHFAEATILTELAKCVFICAKCHRNRHIQLIKEEQNG